MVLGNSIPSSSVGLCLILQQCFKGYAIAYNSQVPSSSEVNARINKSPLPSQFLDSRSHVGTPESTSLAVTGDMGGEWKNMPDESHTWTWQHIASFEWKQREKAGRLGCSEAPRRRSVQAAGAEKPPATSPTVGYLAVHTHRFNGNGSTITNTGIQIKIQIEE